MRHSTMTAGPARQILRFVLLMWMAVARSHAATNYTISLANPEQHLVEVQILLPEGAAQQRVTASGVECAVSGARLRAIRELGARERPCGPLACCARVGHEPLADRGCARRRRG